MCGSTTGRASRPGEGMGRIAKPATDPRWYTFRDVLYARDYDAADAMLRETPILLFLMNGIGETPLHFLAVENDIESVAWLHARGADLDTANLYGTPVIFEVAQLEYHDLFLWFVQHGANVHAHDREGQDLFEYLLEFDKDDMAEWVRRQCS